MELLLITLPRLRRVYFRQASDDAWSACVVDSDRTSARSTTSTVANIDDDQNDAQPVFELGLKYSDCGAGAAATPATIQKITAAGTTTSLDSLSLRPRSPTAAGSRSSLV